MPQTDAAALETATDLQPHQKITKIAGNHHYYCNFVQLETIIETYNAFQPSRCLVSHHAKTFTPAPNLAIHIARCRATTQLLVHRKLRAIR